MVKAQENKMNEEVIRYLRKELATTRDENKRQEILKQLDILDENISETIKDQKLLVE